MKFYLSLLRRSGKRLPADQRTDPDRLVSVSLGQEQAYRLATATCCTGGVTVASLWEPTLVRVKDNELVFQGFESMNDAAVVQEWRLRQHVLSSIAGAKTWPC
jgi:hypothetical protein